MNLIFKAIELAMAIIAFIGALGLGFVGILAILAIISWMIRPDTVDEYQSIKVFVNRCKNNGDCTGCPLLQICLSADIEPHNWIIKEPEDDSNNN